VIQTPGAPMPPDRSAVERCWWSDDPLPGYEVPQRRCPICREPGSLIPVRPVLPIYRVRWSCVYCGSMILDSGRWE